MQDALNATEKPNFFSKIAADSFTRLACPSDKNLESGTASVTLSTSFCLFSPLELQYLLTPF